MRVNSSRNINFYGHIYIFFWGVRSKTIDQNLIQPRTEWEGKFFWKKKLIEIELVGHFSREWQGLHYPPFSCIYIRANVDRQSSRWTAGQFPVVRDGKLYAKIFIQLGALIEKASVIRSRWDDFALYGASHNMKILVLLLLVINLFSRPRQL